MTRDSGTLILIAHCKEGPKPTPSFQIILGVLRKDFIVI